MTTEETKPRGLFRELLDSGNYDYARPRPGEVREGVIIARGAGDLVVDLGGKQDAVVSSSDLQFVDGEYVASLEVGDRIPVQVMRRPFTDNGVQVSLRGGLQNQDWLRAEEMMETGGVVEATVTEFNRGGAVVAFGQLRGFVPNSHLGSLPSGHREGQLQEDRSELIGQTLKLVIIEVNQQRQRLVLSKRAVDRRRRRQLMEELEPGQVRHGIVRSLTDYGAFVDLGGIDGLVHISELARQRVEHPSELLKVGEEVQVYVLAVDLERQRISLSRKRLLPDPWDVVTGNLNIGDTVTGTVTNVVSFGAFVDIGQGVEGLVHESKLPGGAVGNPQIVPGVGVLVQILDINETKHQLGLALLPTEPEPAQAQEETGEAAEVSGPLDVSPPPAEPEPAAAQEDLVEAAQDSGPEVPGPVESPEEESSSAEETEGQPDLEEPQELP